MADTRTIVLAGGTSVHKLAALERACHRLQQDHARLGRPACEFLLPTHAAPSGVPEQPGGLSMIAQGAILRGTRALRAVIAKHDVPLGAYVLGVGIESGLECVLGRWLDIAVVAIVRDGFPTGMADSLVGFSTSVGLPFPAQHVEMALQDAGGLSRHTAGSKVAMVLGGDGTDPHSTLTQGHLSRAQLLADACYAALVQVPGL